MLADPTGIEIVTSNSMAIEAGKILDEWQLTAKDVCKVGTEVCRMVLGE